MAILLPIYGLLICMLLIARILLVLHHLGSGNYKAGGTCLERKGNGSDSLDSVIETSQGHYGLVRRHYSEREREAVDVWNQDL